MKVGGGDGAGAGELVFIVSDGLVGAGDLATDQIGLAADLDVEAAAEARCYGFNSWLRSVYLLGFNDELRNGEGMARISDWGF